MRLAEAGADEPGLAVLRPIRDAELARFAEAEGDLPRARKLCDRAYAKTPRSPFVAVDRARFHGATPVAPEGATAAVRAYAALRASELALERGEIDVALESSEGAERFYTTLRLHHDAARARVARAEALVRLVAEGTAKGEDAAARAEEAISACEEIASPRGYVPILVACALLRAALAERRGDLALAAHAVDRAVRTAGDGVDAALARAALRLGVTARGPRGDAPARRPYEALVERLGMARPAHVLWRIGARAYLADRDEGPPEDVACTVDADARSVVANGASIDLPEQRLSLLCALAAAGERGATLEDIFVAVWRGAYHPLRHRNAVYVALTRLKDSLAPLGRDVRLAHSGDRYRLAGSRPVAVRQRVDREAIRALLAEGHGRAV
jgi:tetratricopeptide (TPR) repeat protein